MDYPYGDNGAPDIWSNDPFATTPGTNNLVSPPKSAPASAPTQKEAPSMRYQVKGGGGDYLLATPTADEGFHNVSRYNSKGDLQYSANNARFNFDQKSGKAGWYGGKNHGGMGGAGELDIYGEGTDTSPRYK
jgi:hypothetical protein